MFNDPRMYKHVVQADPFLRIEIQQLGLQLVSNLY